ncbi:MAG: hypothetical protein ACOZAG_00110 [Patescibacteria group bacterium]
MSVETSWFEEEKRREESLKIEAPKIADEIEERAKNASPKIRKALEYYVKRLRSSENAMWLDNLQRYVKPDILNLINNIDWDGRYIVESSYPDWTIDDFKELYRRYFDEEPEVYEEAEGVPLVENAEDDWVKEKLQEITLEQKTLLKFLEDATNEKERAELIKQMDETNKRWGDTWDLYKKTVRKIH